MDYLQTAEYRQAVCSLEADWDDFRSDLTERQKQTLETLLLREAKVSILEEQASFCSALSIGVDLGRL